MKRTLTAAVFLCLIAVSFASFAGEVDLLRSSLVEGEVLTVTIPYQDKNKLDLTPLLKDYAVVSRTENENVSLVNNRVSSTRFLVLELMPKNTAKGDYVLPSFTVDGEKTRAIPYTVNPPDEALKNGILFQGEILKNAGVEGGQIIYKVTLFDGLGLLSGAINILETNHFTVEQMNESDSRLTTIKGRPYRAYSRLYALFPEKTGRLFLPIFSFEGYSRQRTKGLPEDSAELVRISGLDLLTGEAMPLYLGETKQFHALKTNKETVRIAKRPKEFDGKWFIPAENVSVYMTVPPDQVFTVGQPFSLKVDVHVHGLFATQIPPITLPDTRYFKIYAEPETEHAQYDGDNIIGIRSRTFKVVPTRSGEFAIPPYKVTFFNTKTKRTETVSSKPLTFSVRKNPSLSEADENALPQHHPLASTSVAKTVSEKAFIPFIAGGLFFLLIFLLAVLVVLIMLPRLRFRKALRLGDFDAIHEALLRLKGVSSLSALKARYPKKKKLADRLEAATFGNKKDASLIRDLRKAFVFLFGILFSASFAFAEPSHEQIGEARYYGFLAGMAYGCKDASLQQYENIVGAVMRNKSKTAQDAEILLIDYTNAKRDGVHHQQHNKIKCPDFSKDFQKQAILRAEVYPDGSVLLPDGKWVLARGVNSPPAKRRIKQHVR